MTVETNSGCKISKNKVIQKLILFRYLNNEKLKLFPYPDNETATVWKDHILRYEIIIMKMITQT